MNESTIHYYAKLTYTFAGCRVVNTLSMGWIKEWIHKFKYFNENNRWENFDFTKLFCYFVSSFCHDSRSARFKDESHETGLSHDALHSRCRK